MARSGPRARLIGTLRMTGGYAPAVPAPLLSKPPARPLRLRIVIALLFASLLGFYAFMRVLVVLAPSDPCGPTEAAACASADQAWLISGLVAGALALLCAGLVGYWAWSRARLDFNVPPGWPTPPRNWRVTPGWEPDPRWPEPPNGWQFWVRGRR